jgi:predicted hydrocarbon binding protein
VIHSIVPLAVLEAIRNLDTPVEDGLGELAGELMVKRLGLSATVRTQLAEYEALVRRDGRVADDLVEALLRLVGRRPDAELVFADAGRRAARRAVRRAFIGSRALARLAPRRWGYALAAGVGRSVLGGELRREERVPVLRVRDPVAVQATPEGTACALYAAGFSELLRLLADFEGAMLHVTCRARGDARCEWRAAPADPRHH